MQLSNLTSRILVALVAIPAIIYVTLIGGIPFFLFVLAISILSLIELYKISEKKGCFPQYVFGIIGLITIEFLFFLDSLYLIMAIIVFTILSLLIELFRNKGSAFFNIGATLFGTLYLGLSLGSLMLIRKTFSNEGKIIIAIFASIWMCDTAAYFVGKKFGKHKMFVRVSPNKTWEGGTAGFFASIIIMVIAQKFFFQDSIITIAQSLIIGTIIGVFGQLGDFIESLFKRDAGVKDSSHFIPGHGGVWDRFDSLIFVSPIIAIFLYLMAHFK